MTIHRFVLLVALAACDSGKSATAPTSSEVGSAASSAAPAEAKLCGAAQSLKERVAPIDADASRTSVPQDIALPESKQGERPPQGSVVAFEKGRMTFDGQPLNAPGAVLGLLEQRGQEVVLLAVDKSDEDLGRVAAVAEAVGDGARVYLLASPPGAKAAKAPAALGKEVSELSVSERATKLAEALKAAIKDCPAANKLFSSLATQPPDTRAASLKNELPVAVHACDCKVGTDLVELVAYVLEGDRITVGKRLVFAPDGKPIAAKGMKGQALYDALPADGAPVRLER